MLQKNLYKFELLLWIIYLSQNSLHLVTVIFITKTNSKYLIGSLDKAIRPLILIMPRMSGYVKTFKVEDKNNKLMSFHIDVEKLLEKYKAIWIKIKALKNIELNALPIYDERYINTKIRTCGLNVPEDDVKYKSFTAISIDFLLLYETKCYLLVYLDNCAYKIVSK